jgi:anti-anti-sigma regulatory factor
MKLALSTGWDIEVDRGPDWLFVRLHEPSGGLIGGAEFDLADRLWEIVEQNFARRLVVELDDVSILPSYLVGQLVKLHKRFVSKGGIMRICGVSPHCAQVLTLHRLTERLHPYGSREEAVLGVRAKPR